MRQDRPVIAREEYPQRWEKARGVMEKLNLDFLVAYADDRATFGPAHARWLVDFPVHFEPCCVILARKGDPALLVGPESPHYAKLRTPVSDIRVLREFTHPDEDYPYTKIEALKDVAASLAPGLSSGRIGLAGRSLMGADVYASFKAALPGEWVDADRELAALRAVKSEGELAVMRHAYGMAEAGLAAAVEAVRPGVLECEVAAEAEYVMRRMGAEGLGIDTFVASGMNSSPIIARATLREIRGDEIVLLTLAPRYQGYHAAVGLPVLLGAVSAEAKRAARAAAEAISVCAGKMRPGAGREVEAAGREVMRVAGFERNFLYSGIHSVGVIEFEAPIFGPGSGEIMRDGMVLSVDIPVFDGPWGGLRVEDGFLVGPNGAERLTRIPYLIER